MSTIRWVNENKAYTQVPSKLHEGFLRKTRVFEVFDFSQEAPCFQFHSLVIHLPGWDSQCSFDDLETAKAYGDRTLKELKKQTGLS